jgi:hypothetical protein
MFDDQRLPSARVRKSRADYHFSDISHNIRHCINIDMFRTISGVAFAAVIAAAASATMRVGDSWGTNIHWTTETQPGEAAMLARSFKLVGIQKNQVTLIVID